MDGSPGTPPARQPLRVLILTDTAIVGSGGSERFLRNLLQNLPASEYRVTLVQLCAEPAARDRLHAGHPGALEAQMYLPISAVYARDGLRVLRKLRRMVHEQHFDVIQSQHESSDVFNALLPRGSAHAARISNRRDTGFLKNARLRMASRVLNHRYDRIIAPSQAILEAVARSEGVAPARMRCIPNGVDTERFRHVSGEQRRALRQTLGYPEDSLLVGCVGSLTPVKRHADLLEAFALVCRELPAARLLLVGDGPLRDQVVSTIDRLGLVEHVHLLGPRHDVQDVLATLDLFVLASETEGMSNAILEAQACGLPVVATRVGGNPDLVRSDCGVLVPTGEPAQLADALLRLLRDPATRDSMGASARAYVVEHHSLARMARAYDAMYRELVNGR